jgi:hypothetical protein
MIETYPKDFDVLSILAEVLIQADVMKSHKHMSTPWFQSTKQTIPTERPPLVGEVSASVV